jgi:hypothetical protein
MRANMQYFCAGRVEIWGWEGSFTVSAFGLSLRLTVRQTESFPGSQESNQKPGFQKTTQTLKGKFMVYGT